MPQDVLNYIDGHHRHNTFASIEYAGSNVISLLTLPPNRPLPSKSSPDRPIRHQTYTAVSRVTRPSTYIPLVTRPFTAVPLVT